MPPDPVPRVLAIAGSDSSGGAGLQADLATFAAHGVAAATVVTAVTAQSPAGAAVWPVDLDALHAQLETALATGPAAVKIGLLADARIAVAVASALDGVPVPVVLDPVLAASTGAPLCDEAGLVALREQVLARAALVTPNLPEAAAILGADEAEVAADPAAAAEELLARGGRPVLLKGGHARGDVVVDRLVGLGPPVELRHPRVGSGEVRGTGCALSSAIVAQLARGLPLQAAAETARAWLQRALERHAEAPDRAVWSRPADDL